MSETKESPVLAVIDLGAHSARMLIAQCGPKPGKIHILEDLDVTVPLGSDVFRTGEVSAATIQMLCDIFLGFREKMREYDVVQYRAIATSAVREASNTEILCERIYHRTGMNLQIYEGADEARLNCITVMNSIPRRIGFEKKHAIIADIGTGACQISTYDKGALAFTETLKLGTLRVLELLPGTISTTALQEYLSPVIGQSFSELRHSGSDLQGELLIAMGASVRMFYRIFNEMHRKEVNPKMPVMKRGEFEELRDKLALISIEDLCNEFGIPTDIAEAVMPCTVILDNLFRISGAEYLMVPHLSLKQSLMQDFANEILSGSDSFEEQTLKLVQKTSLKYYGDPDYFNRVSNCAEALFCKLEKLHGLGKRELLILKIAAIMHKAGQFINNGAYHKHSAYIVASMEIPGISLQERKLAAFTVRYHRKAIPLPQHTDFQNLMPEERSIVQKLSAILRIAIILGSRQADPARLKAKQESGKVIILTGMVNPYPEQNTVVSADFDYFSHVFALQVILQ